MSDNNNDYLTCYDDDATRSEGKKIDKQYVQCIIVCVCIHARICTYVRKKI